MGNKIDEEKVVIPINNKNMARNIRFIMF